MGFPAVPSAPAVRAWNIDIRQELDIQRDLPGPVAGGAAQLSGIVGKVTCLVAALFCVRRAGVDFAQIIVDICIGRHSGPHIDADWSGVDQLDLIDAGGLQRLHMGGIFFALYGGRQCRNQALKDHSCLTRTGDACDHRQPPFGDLDIKWMHRVDLAGPHVDHAVRK